LRGLSVAKEAADKSIEEPTVNTTKTFATPNGEFIKQNEECNKESNNCQTGVLVVFRTTGFVEAGTGVVPAGGSLLQARGSWAVTAN
jgi:hypothetical protein